MIDRAHSSWSIACSLTRKPSIHATWSHARRYQAAMRWSDVARSGFLKISPALAGIIRRDARVRECIRNQTPILVRSPSSEAAMDVEAIAERLLAS